MRKRVFLSFTIALVFAAGCKRGQKITPASESAPTPDLRTIVCTGVDGLGGDRGGPTAVAADDALIFLGWQGAERGQEIVAVDPGGGARWSYHRGPGVSGVGALAADGGVVFVLGGEGGELYKLDAKNGTPLTWDGRPESSVKVTSLWPDDAPTNPTVASALTARNGRIYLTFTPQGFIAVLDAATGKYVTTLTASEPAQMALSTTPMNDPDSPGGTKIIDFGICALGRHGLAYFLMNHEPAWVMESTTNWLAPDEQIVAFTMRADTMKSGAVTLYTAIGAPHRQVHLRSADAPEGFQMAIGTHGGRAESGPWNPAALGNVRALAVDALGQVWIAEAGTTPKRFSVWKTDGPQPTLVREIFGPLDMNEPAPAPDPRDPTRILAQSCSWRMDAQSGKAECVEVIDER